MTPCSLDNAVTKDVPPCNFLFVLIPVNITFTDLQVPDLSGGSPLAIHQAVT